MTEKRQSLIPVRMRNICSQRKAQAAFEYMIIIGFAFLISVPLILQAQQSAVSLEQSTTAVTGKSALNTIEEASRFVWSQGHPARLTFDITIPEDTTQSNVTDESFQLTVEQGGDENRFINTVPFAVNGTIPTVRGVHEMRVFVNESDVIQLRQVS